MAGQLGVWLGGFLILYLVSAFVLLIFKENKWTFKAVTIAALIAFAVGIILTPYGPSDEGPTQLLNGITNYFVPFAGVLIVNLIRVNRKLAKREKELESTD